MKYLIFILAGAVMFGCAQINQDALQPAECDQVNELSALDMIATSSSDQELATAIKTIKACKGEAFFVGLAPTVLIEAKDGSQNAQLTIAEIRRLQGKPALSLRWFRILSNAGNLSAAKYLDAMHSADPLSGGRHGRHLSTEYLKLAKRDLLGEDFIHAEEILYRAADLSKKEENFDITARAYMNLGNINMYHKDSELNEEFGEYGFSAQSAMAFYEKALVLSREHSDPFAEANARSALLISLHALGDEARLCNEARILVEMYDIRRDEFSLNDGFQVTDRVINRFSKHCGIGRL